MNVVIVTNSTSYEPRAEKVGQFLQQYGHQVMWLESDFHHIEKKKLRRELAGHQYIDTVPYQKNMSVRRLYSHYDFSKKMWKTLENQTIDLLYVLIPSNSLLPAAVRLKKKLGAKLVIDMIDLWPESLPIKILEGSWPIRVWKNLRDDYLPSADLILTECGLYQELLGLKDNPNGTRAAVMYWPKEREAAGESRFWTETEELHLAYLGSINHIIDMDLIVDLLQRVDEKKKVRLHVIGDGENREAFLEKLKNRGIETEYYGIIYEEEEKRVLLDRCSFGINMMKEKVCVGLTMKSIDYFCYGLPLINNIPGDTWELVEQQGVGVNCGRKELHRCAEEIVRMSEGVQEKRQVARMLYERLFTKEAMEEVLKRELLPLLGKER